MAKSPEQRSDALREKMVGWYDPAQLALTGLQTVLSSLFAQRADYRLIEALKTPAPEPGPYGEREDIWIDYVADVGDGFNSTYAVARAITADSIAHGETTLPRGRVLIMGGDEVYPTPSAAGYRTRLVHPYELALPASGADEPPDLYAIPGNHDWYDGLGNFMNLFCHGKRIGAYRTPQQRSYFALELPHRTWLLGVDIQLESDIDNPQLDYFKSLPLARGDRIILATAEPDWIYGNIYEGKKKLSDLEKYLSEELGAKIILQLAGDLHHYRRHTLVEADGASGHVHLVTAGGGGAFLHPTHTHDVDVVKIGDESAPQRYALHRDTEYPSREISRRLGLANIPFFLKNPWFGVVPGGIYTLLSWVMPPAEIDGKGGHEAITTVLYNGLVEVSKHPSSLVWVVAILLGFVAFTDTHKPLYKWLGGLTHGSAHLAGALFVSNFTSHLLAKVTDNPVVERLLLALGSFAGGYVIGSLLMGLYLAISVCVFRRHGNEAFSSLKIEGFKNFLRMRVDADGLAVWALALDRVPGDGQWREVVGDDGRSRPEPTKDAPSLVPRVLDHFVIPARLDERPKKHKGKAAKKPG
jgi:hypothetical protein